MSLHMAPSVNSHQREDVQIQLYNNNAFSHFILGLKWFKSHLFLGNKIELYNPVSRINSKYHYDV